MRFAERGEVISMGTLVVFAVTVAPELRARSGAPHFQALRAGRLDFRTIRRRLRANGAYDEDWTRRQADHALRDRAQ